MRVISRQTFIRKLLAGSLIFYAISGLTSVINYLFYPVISRLVSTSEYGEVQFLVSMFTQLAVGFVVLNILAIIVSIRASSPEDQKRDIATLNFISSLIIAGVVVVGSVLLYLNRESVAISSLWSIVALGIALLINVPFTVRIGQLQGNDRFLASGVLSIVASMLRLVLAVLFINAGFGVAGAIFGIALGMLISLALSFLVDGSRSFSQKVQKSNLSSISHIKSVSIAAIISVTLITLLSTVDLLIARASLPVHDAGQYAAVATIAKTILAATAPLVWLSLPPAVRKNLDATVRYIVLGSVVSVVMFIIFTTFPADITKLLLNIQPGNYVSLMGVSSFAMAVMSVAFIVNAPLLCADSLKASVVWSSIGAALWLVITLLLPSGGHSALYASLVGQIVAGLIIIVPGTFHLVTSRHQGKV